MAVYRTWENRTLVVQLYSPTYHLGAHLNGGVKAEVIDWTRYKADGSPRSGIADRTPDNGFAR